MGKFSALLINLVSKNPIGLDKRSKCIFYKIVDCINESEYILQCVNTKAIFKSSIISIVYDIDILRGLHPVQSCYVGIEYATQLKQSSETAEKKISLKKIFDLSVSRYGLYSIYYQKRNGEVCFVEKNTKNEIIMDPRDIALSEELIQEFDSMQSFYIGILAGLKPLNSIINPHEKPLENSFHLRLVK